MVTLPRILTALFYASPMLSHSQRYVPHLGAADKEGVLK